MAIEREVALLKQAQVLGADSTKFALEKVEKGMETLAFKIDNVAEKLATGFSEPAGSAAGRALSATDHELRIDVDDHERRLKAQEAFQVEVLTAVRTVRVQTTLVGTVLSILVGILTVVEIVNRSGAIR